MLEGLQLCGPCAVTSRSRLQRVLTIAALLAFMAVASGATMALLEGGAWWVAPAVVLGEVALLYGGTLSVMKRLNRTRAAELSAAGEVWPLVESASGRSVGD